MSKDKYTGQFTGDVLKAAVQVLLEDGYKVTVNNLPAKDDRPAGTIIFIAGMELRDGKFLTLGAVPV